MTDENLPVRVVEALAHAEQKSPELLEFTLYEHIDPDVLRSLARHENTTWELSFEVPDHEVTVTDNGNIFVDDDSV